MRVPFRSIIQNIGCFKLGIKVYNFESCVEETFGCVNKGDYSGDATLNHAGRITCAAIDRAYKELFVTGDNRNNVAVWKFTQQ